MKKTYHLHPLSQQTKRMLLGILCAISVSQIFGYNFKVDGIYYNKKSSTEVEVTYINTYYNSYSGGIVIPESITYKGNNYSVTSIGSSAFSGCSGLTEVTIPNSVTSIGEFAFDECSGLTEVTIPNSVTSIGSYAFSGCSGLTELTIPNSVTSIGLSAFRNCSGLTELTIPNSVTSIRWSAFEGCSELTEVTIPNSVTYIEGYAFKNCSGLTEVTIPNSVTSIGDYAFSGCSGLTEVTIEDGTEILSFSMSFSSPFTDCPLETLYLGRDVSYDSSYSPFRDKGTLTTLTIGNSVTSIRWFAFEGCSGLTEVTIPNSVTSIGSYAFSGCSGLTEVTIEDGTEILSFSMSFSSPFTDCPLETLYLGRDVSYDSSDSPFRDKGTLTTLTIGNSVTSIGEFAFDECSGLTELTIPNSVTSIGDYAFSGCSGLTEVTIEDGTEILSFSMSFSSPFTDCPLETLYLGRDVSYDTSYSPFRDKGTLTTLTIGNSVTSIGSHAFSYCSGLTEVTIPNSVTSIGEFAFDECSGLTEVTIPNSVTSIGSHAFSLCSGLKAMTIGNNVTSIGDYAFSNCSGLTEVTIPKRVISIGKDAFFGCNGLTEMTIPNSVTSIGDYAFYECSGLKSVTIADGTETLSLSSSTFLICPLETLYLGRDISYGYSQSPFSKTTLKEVTIGESVTSIGEKAFYSCDKNLRIISLAKTPPVTKSSIHATSLEVPLGCSYNYARAENWQEIEEIYAIKDDIKLYPVILEVDGEKIVSLNGIIEDGIEGEAGESVAILPYNPKLLSSSMVIASSKEITDSLIVNGHYSFSISSYHKNNYVITSAFSIKDVTLSTEGTLLEKIGTSNIENIQCLKVSGNVNGTDILTIRKMTNLHILDLKDANIVDGGLSYYKDYVTSKDAIGDYFFKDKSNLRKVMLPKTAKEIKYYAFADCINLQSMTIPNCVTSIGDYAFFGCNGLTEMTIPNSVTSIGYNAFDGCSRLTEVTIADGTETLSLSTSEYSTPFSDCPLKSLYLGRDIIYSYENGSYTNYHSPFKDKKTLTSVTIGSHITSIGVSTFSGCSGLTEVTIPKSITSIGGSAFSRCSGLTEVTIPNSVKSIGYYAFSDCSGLTEVTIPNSVTSIGDHAFKGCRGLTSVTIPNSVTTIKDYAFSDCYRLISLTIGNRVTSIGYGAFSGCSGLTEVTIPNSVTSIGSSAFAGCGGLTSVTIPNSVTSIGNSAFLGCSGLTSVTSLNTTPPVITSSTFDETTEKNATLNVPIGCKNIYWLHPFWENFTNIEEIEVHEDISEKQVDALAFYDSGMVLCEEFTQLKVDYDSVYEQLQKQTAENEKLQSEIETKADEIRKRSEDSTLSEDDKQKFISLLEEILSVQEKDAKKRLKKQAGESYSIEEGIFTEYLNRLNGYKSSIETATTRAEIESLINTMNEDHTFVMGQYQLAKEHYTELTEELEAAKQREDEMKKLLQRLESLSLNFDTTVTDIEQMQLSNDEVIVYTIAGEMKIIKHEQIQSLPKGVYIIEGKKVFVK